MITNTRKHKTNSSGQTFLEWQNRVDEYIQDRVGLCLSDLPDKDIYNSWQNDVPAYEFAIEILAEEGYEEE